MKTMEISCSHTVPTKSGYYLVQCAEKGTPHLVLVVIKDGEKPQILNEGKPLFYNEFPYHFFWSEIINIK